MIKSSRLVKTSYLDVQPYKDYVKESIENEIRSLNANFVLNDGHINEVVQNPQFATDIEASIKEVIKDYAKLFCKDYGLYD